MYKKRLIFAVPRYHTNLIPVIDSLKNTYKIEIIVANIGNTESHNLIKPILCKELFFSKFIRKIFCLNNQNFLIPNFFFLYSFIGNFKPDFIIIRTHNRFFYYTIAVIGKILNAKVIFYDQLDLKLRELKKNNLINFIKKMEFNFKEFFFKSIRITPVNFNKQKKFNKNYYIPFCFFSKRKKNFSKKKLLNLITVSKYEKRKNLLLLCRSVLQLKKAGFKFKLVIIGEKKTNNQKKIYNIIYNFLKSNKLLNNYVFLKTNYKYENMDTVYKISDLFILPSTMEPAAISVLEAMSFGLPVIVSDDCGTSCYIKKNFTGRIFKNNNLSSITKHIQFFFNNPQYVKIYSKRSLNSFNKLYTTKCFLNNFNTILNKH